MRWTLSNRHVWGGFGLTLFVFGLISYFLYHNMVITMAAAEARKHSHIAVVKTELFLSDLIAAETGQRGYLLTGKRTYLQPYQLAVRQLASEFHELQTLISDHPGQRQRLEAIYPLLQEKLQELKSTIRLRQIKGLQAATQMVQTDQGKRDMDQLRSYVLAIEAEENRLYQKQDDLVQQNFFFTLVFSSIAGFLALGFMSLIYSLLIHEMLVRQKINESLELTLQERALAEAKLIQTNQELQESEERFRLLVQGIKDYAIFRLDPQGLVQTWNQGAERINGYSAQEIIGQHFSRFYPSEAIQQGYPEYELQRAHTQGQFENQGWRVRKDGSRFWAKVLITALYNLPGHLVGFAKITQDLTEQKQAEDRLKASEQQYRQLAETLQHQSTQLQAVNKEMEAFAYSVSHDLRAPLRGIDGFSQVLLEQYTDQLDEQGKHYLNRVRQGSQQMGKLIDDMLQLSRLTRGELTIATVNLSTMVKNIITELQARESERIVSFMVAENIVVQGDEQLLHAVLQNLLENAWKYTSKHQSACIEFGVTEHQGQLAYFIKDDGAGFDMKYVGKLFGAFQRLHGTAEFPGTGVGLATVARIIHRHGGEVWAQAEVEKGATFYFTLGLAVLQDAEGGHYATAS